MKIYMGLNHFIGLLEQMIALFEQLLAVIEQEKEAVIAADLETFNTATKTKDNLLLKLRILEEQRNHLTATLADHLQQPAGTLTLTQLALLLDAPYNHQLMDCRARLVAIITAVERANAHNRDLFSHSLALVQGSVNLLNNLMIASPTYFRNGNIQGRGHTGKILQGEI